MDPGDAQWNAFDPDRMLGCVVYPAAEVSEPGTITHVEGNRFSVGEPSGEKSPRAEALSKALSTAGLRAPVRPRLRDEIWVKLRGNLSFNPISALTHATLDVLCTDPGTRAVARAMMVEAQTIAESWASPFPSTSTAASTAGPPWARTARRCCRTCWRAARWRFTR